MPGHLNYSRLKGICHNFRKHDSPQVPATCVDDIVLSALRHAHEISSDVLTGPAFSSSPMKIGYCSLHPSLRIEDQSADCLLWYVTAKSPLFNELDLERWSVDAGDGPHVILHMNRPHTTDLPEMRDVRHLCYDAIAKFLGVVVIEGWTPPVHPASGSIPEEEVVSTEAWPLRRDVYVVRPRIDAQNWAAEREVSGTLRPVLRRCRVAVVSGELTGPQGETEHFEGVVLDPGIHVPLELIEPGHLMEWTPDLNEVEAGSQRAMDRMHEEIIELFSIRRAMPALAGDETARVLRWWKPNLSTMSVDDEWALLPAWEIFLPGMQRSVLCGWSGVVLVG